MSMRVLFTTPAALGHIHPMAPLARAMLARGHEVLWAVPADGVVDVERAGVRAVRAGPAGLTRPLQVISRYPDLQTLPPADLPDLLFGRMFGAVATPPILADLAPVVLEWRPDLVVADAADFAGHILAAELGVASVTKGFGPLLPERRVAAAGNEVASLWLSRGLEPRPYGGAYDHLYLDVYPDELQPWTASHIPHRHLLRPVSDDGQGADVAALPLPELPEGRGGAPLVYVTMGTIFNDARPLHMVLAALAALDVRVLVTVGPKGDPAALGPQPPYIRVERYVPQTAVLPHCDLAVSHGGSGTVLSGLALGLPQLCLPQGADQFLNASAVTSTGAGLSLSPGDATVAAVEQAAARLLGEPSFRSAAVRLAAAIESMPSSGDVAAVLEDVASR